MKKLSVSLLTNILPYVGNGTSYYKLYTQLLQKGKILPGQH